MAVSPGGLCYRQRPIDALEWSQDGKDQNASYTHFRYTMRSLLRNVFKRWIKASNAMISTEDIDRRHRQKISTEASNARYGTKYVFV